MLNETFRRFLNTVSSIDFCSREKLLRFVLCCVHYIIAEEGMHVREFIF